MPKSFYRTPGLHCYSTSSVKIQSSVSFLRQRFSHMSTVRLARCSQPLPPCPEHHTCVWLVPGVGGALARLRRRVPRRQNHRNGRQGGTVRHNAVRHRPNLLRASRGHLLASAHMQHRRRGLARIGCTLCHRRVVRPFRRGQAVTTPSLLSWTVEWHQCFV